MTGIKQLWQSQDREKGVITLADIQARSGKFRGRIRWRNVLLAAYSLCALAVFAFWFVRVSRVPVMTPQMAALMPSMILAALAHLWILFALWSRGRARPLPDDTAGEAALDFHRCELAYQRAAAASAWAWYILPFVPGAVASFWMLVRHPPPHFPPQMLPILIVADLLFFAAVWLAFSRSAARLELELERLKSLRAE
jgi:hypothetical protein